MADDTNTEALKAFMAEWFDRIEAKIDRILAMLAKMKAEGREFLAAHERQAPSKAPE
jgi:hypothetical protein